MNNEQEEHYQQPAQVTVNDLFASSSNQEHILAQMLEVMKAINVGVEKLGVRISNVETAIRDMHTRAPASASATGATTGREVSRGGSTTPPQVSEPRGSLPLPPGMRPGIATASVAPVVLAAGGLRADEAASRAVADEERRKREDVALERKRQEDAERIAKLEAERKRREEEETRKRLEERQREEEERKRKEIVQAKTKNILAGLITESSELFPDESSGGTGKKQKSIGGLFDESDGLF